MKYTIDGWNNFCRVFELPGSYPRDYCFGGGHRVNFQMVDWFCPVPDLGVPAISKAEWRERVGEIETTEVDIEELSAQLVPFLQKKNYVKPGRQYLVLTDFGAAIRFDAPVPSGGTEKTDE